MRRAGSLLSGASRTPLSRPTLGHSAFPALRHASTSAPPSAPRRFLSSTLLLAAGGAFVAYYYDSRAVLHDYIAMPILRRLDAEQSHQMAVRLLSWNRWFRPSDRGVDGPELQAEIFGLPLSNPVGMAAGFDKHGDAIDGLFDLGFGYVEIGSVTPQSQPGNPKPRFFRLMEDNAAINRYGFNSLGHAYTLAQLRARVLSFARSNPTLFPNLARNTAPLPPSGLPRSLRPGHLLAVNLGKNKTSAADSNDDYIRGVRLLGPYADVVVINVSSPNTPGLRALQGREVLEKLLTDVVQEREKIKVDGLPKIAVKVACDLSEEELVDVASAVRRSGVEGVIVSNTTVRREGLGLQSDNASQVGGLSGKPLFPLALHAVRTIRPLLPPTIPVIGCGGISTASDALSMARAGASTVQLYTSFGYRGIGLPALLKDELSADLNASGRGQTWKSQIGRDWSEKDMGWDEKRLEKESKALKQHAEDLGQMLRKAFEDDDMARLIQEAEVALGGPRDNLAGAKPGAGVNSEAASQAPKSDVAQALIEAVQADAPVAQPSSPALIQASAVAGAPPAATAAPATAPVPAEPEVRASAPLGGPLGPIVVQEVRTVDAAAPRRDDAWTGAVRNGSKRLV